MIASLTIDQAIADPTLLGAALGPLESWSTWLTILRAAFASGDLSEDELDLLAELAGPSRSPPPERVRELWVLAGRRGGKSRAAALVASYIGMLDHRHLLAPGETGFIVVLSPTRDQSKTIFGYIKAFFASSPILQQMVINHNTEEIVLDNGITIAVTTNSFRTVRSRTLVAAIFDETAFWRDENSANPDQEIYRATIPALITTGGLLIGISSPYRKVGLIFQKWRDHFNTDGPVLVIRAPTTRLNPTIDQKRIDEEYAADPEAAASEWGAEFRSDLSSLLDDASIDAAIDFGRPLELPPRDGIQYVAFTDASAGKHDSFTIGIGHVEDGTFVADVIRGRKPPFDPAHVAVEYAMLARDYGCRHIVGDAFAGRWVSDAFDRAGLPYRQSRLPKSGLYLEMAPSFSRGTVSIPDAPPLIRELRLLERRTHRSGKDSVDHPQNGSDDLANALAGALFEATLQPEAPSMVVGRYGGGGGGAVVFGEPDHGQPEVGSAMTSGQDYLDNGEVNPDRILDRNPARLEYLRRLEEMP